MLPSNINYVNPIISRRRCPLYQRGVSSPLSFASLGWNDNKTNGTVKSSHAGSYCPNKPIYVLSSTEGCTTDAQCVYSSNGFGGVVENGSGRDEYYSSVILPSYPCRRHFVSESSKRIYNGVCGTGLEQRVDESGWMKSCRVVTSTTNATKQPVVSSATAPACATPMVMNGIVISWWLPYIVFFNRPVPLFKLVKIDEAQVIGSPDLLDNQELQNIQVPTEVVAPPQQVAQESGPSNKCVCYHGTHTPFCICNEPGNSQQQNVETSKMEGLVKGSSSSETTLQQEPNYFNHWNKNEDDNFLQNRQESPVAPDSVQPQAQWSPQFTGYHPANSSYQYYQERAYTSNLQCHWGQGNYMSLHHTTEEYVHVMSPQSHVRVDEDPPLKPNVSSDIPQHLKMSDFNQNLVYGEPQTNGLVLSRTTQKTYYESQHSGYGAYSNQMVLKVCTSNTQPMIQKTVGMFDQEDAFLPCPATVPKAQTLFQNFRPNSVDVVGETLTCTFGSEYNPSFSALTTAKLAGKANVPLYPIQNVSMSGYNTSQTPHFQQQKNTEPLPGGEMYDMNRVPFENDRETCTMIENLEDIETTNNDLNMSGSSTVKAYQSYSDTQQSGGVTTSTGRHSAERGDVSNNTNNGGTQQYVLNYAASHQGQTGSRVERDSDISKITLKSLLETPCSPRTRSGRNAQLEEYQQMLADEKRKKSIDAMKAKENGERRDSNGHNNGGCGNFNYSKH